MYANFRGYIEDHRLTVLSCRHHLTILTKTIIIAIMQAPSADELALDVAREDYKIVADLAKHVLRIWSDWTNKYKLATDMLCRSSEDVESVVYDSVEFEVHEELFRRRSACEEAFDSCETAYREVEELRLKEVEKIRVIVARIELALEAAIERALEAADDTRRG
ncbi:hypothetical protein MMC17_004953 [Xylographa soralifera]|nr:hypothetical protein [Xylographa soralifera]